MRPGTLDIHVRLPDSSVLLSFFPELEALVDIFHQHFIEPFDVNSILFIFVNEHFLFLCLLKVVFQQVEHRLVVKLQEGTVHFDVFAPGRDEVVEDVMDCAWNQTAVVFVLLD
jgi:hypothetical protein